MCRKVPTDMNFVARGDEIEKFWVENQIFEEPAERREGYEIYMSYNGPPIANGKPHIDHVETRVIKDMIPRYHAMKRQYVPRKAGWDAHGLPVKLEVEREIGIEGKDETEAYGVGPFTKECREFVWRHKEIWERSSGKAGF